MKSCAPILSCLSGSSTFVFPRTCRMQKDVNDCKHYILCRHSLYICIAVQGVQSITLLCWPPLCSSRFPHVPACDSRFHDLAVIAAIQVVIRCRCQCSRRCRSGNLESKHVSCLVAEVEPLLCEKNGMHSFWEGRDWIKERHELSSCSACSFECINVYRQNHVMGRSQ